MPSLPNVRNNTLFTDGTAKTRTVTLNGVNTVGEHTSLQDSDYRQQEFLVMNHNPDRTEINRLTWLTKEHTYQCQYLFYIINKIGTNTKQVALSLIKQSIFVNISMRYEDSIWYS